MLSKISVAVARLSLGGEPNSEARWVRVALRPNSVPCDLYRVRESANGDSEQVSLWLNG